MAYNTRPNGEGVSSVGMRRNAPLVNNFVPGGQLAPPRMPQQQRQFFRPLGPPKQQGAVFGQRLPALAPQRPPPSPVPPVQQKPPQVLQQEMKNEPQVDAGEGEKKSFWSVARAGSAGKITRKERQRRRNVRLSRILQPKNAVMILNELVKSATYTVSDAPQLSNMNQYAATVLVEGINHTGQGRSKMEAKSMAAEAALKYIVKNRQFSAYTKDADGDEMMELEQDGTPALPWQHMASFALYKLLNSWGEDMNPAKGQETSAGQLPQNKPARRLPENASQMNPLMLINQMLPHAQFEEMGRTGNVPNVSFMYKCTIEGRVFNGAGPNKKTAKKLAAFAACHNILNIEYPPEVYTPTK